MHKRWLFLATMLVVIGGCGNPGGLSDIEHTAKLRNEREAYDKSWKDSQDRVDAQISAEQERQRQNSNR